MENKTNHNRSSVLAAFHSAMTKWPRSKNSAAKKTASVCRAVHRQDTHSHGPGSRPSPAAAGHRQPGDRKDGSGRPSSHSASPTAASSLTHPENMRCTRAGHLRAPPEPRAQPMVSGLATAPPRAGRLPEKPPLAT